MLSVILACDDPYETADLYTGRLGWRLVFATPRDSGDPLACVALGDAEVMLGVAEEQFLPAASRAHRGAGVSIYIRLPEGEDIAAIHERHAAAGVVTTPLSHRPWGVRAFNAVIDGYQFLVTQQDAAGEG
ncbi:MAG TPA: VOC family protein [Streptosporangiaceae bacterium]|jgi:catechol 2,3-dioxygenase-like lactoylglutathione lyase family enzyme